MYFEFEKRKYCKHDFQVLFASCCAKCSEFIVGRVIKALSATWHPQCLTCHRWPHVPCNLSLSPVSPAPPVQVRQAGVGPGLHQAGRAGRVPGLRRGREGGAGGGVRGGGRGVPAVRGRGGGGGGPPAESTPLGLRGAEEASGGLVRWRINISRLFWTPPLSVET